MSAHSAGSGATAHPWVDAIGEVADSVKLSDSASFTPAGRRLLVALGVVEPDPLRVEAEEWLRSRRGPATEASHAVRAALRPSMPVVDWVRSSRAFRNVK